MKVQGTLWHGSSWRLGHLFLTNQRLSFIQVTKKIFEVRLDRIIEIGIVKRNWLFGVRVKQLCIGYHSGTGKKQVYIAMSEPKKWRGIITENITKMLLERRSCNGSESNPPSDTQ